MTLSAASALPLQLEKTEKKKREPNMPIGKYFSGHGAEVLASMKKKNGEEAGTREFYATANKTGQKPASESKPKRRMTLGQRIAAKD